MTSPTQDTLRKLREEGYTAQVVEKWNSFAKIRQDLFGGIDVVALHPGKNGVLGVQACAVGSQSARIKKLLQEPKLQLWIECGNQLEVWGWGTKRSLEKTKDGKRSKKQVRVVTIHRFVWLTESGVPGMGEIKVVEHPRSDTWI